MSDETTLLKSLSKLKTAGKLHYWRGTIEIPEIELHAICDEIQAEYDNAVHALNKAAGNWAKADAELREKGEAMTDNRTTERVDHPPRVREAIDELMREKDATDNRTTELLSCPFCGGEAEFNIYNTTCLVECSKCRIGTPHHLIEEYENAIAAWNTRAERTCKSMTDDNAWCFACSECGKSFPRNKLHLAHNHGEINYCPNCGRKVVRA